MSLSLHPLGSEGFAFLTIFYQLPSILPQGNISSDDVTGLTFLYGNKGRGKGMVFAYIQKRRNKLKGEDCALLIWIKLNLKEK